MNKMLGCLCCEYAQKLQVRFEVHTYPSGNKVVKAFIHEDWIFYDKKGRIIKHHSWAMMAELSKCKINFHIQKNRQNGQAVTIVADDKNILICAVHAAYRIFLRSIELGQRDEEPMGVF